MREPQLLVVNGDSVTWGSEHADPQRTTWAAVVGERLSIPVVNLAAPGGSNARLVRTTVELLPAVCDRRGVVPDEVLFVGMWTLPNRREYWADGPHRWRMHGEHFNDGNWRMIGPWGLRTGHPQSETWFRDLQHADADLDDYFCSMVLLERWLSRFGCPFVLASAHDFLRLEALDRYGRYVSQLRDEHFLGGVRGLVDATFRDLVSHLHDRGPNGHKLAASHRFYAEEHLLPHISGLARPARHVAR